jgi:alpha-1,3-glucosyltransferase
MVVTLLAISPGLGYIWCRPLIKRLPHVFTLSALGFFLFGFQVHEKSILLALLPASLLLFSSDAEERKWTVWLNVIGTVRCDSPLR